MTRVAQRQNASSVSIPSPVGGWNARDSIADMNPVDAVTLENWFPRTGDVLLRKGHSNHVTGIGNQVESLMPYNSPTTSTFFCAAGTSFYNVTSSGAVGAAVQSGLTNARWQWANFATAGGNFLYCVNGADSPRLWDGATWTAVTGVSTPSITGVTTSNLIHVNVFKKRLWFVEKETLKVWYLPVDSIGGAASAFDFRSVAKRGGYLMAMGTWTIDAGEGVDDHAVFITSEGEFIVYKGNDPSSADDWFLVGVWQLGAPIGRRCFRKFGGDLLVITRDGLLPMSKALISDRTNPRVALTDKIQGAMNTAAVSYGDSFGWDVTFFAEGTMVVMNVPVSLGSQEQYVMNSITGAWCKFTGWDANCFEIFDGDLYFGGNGVVCKAWNTLADNGTNIDATAKQAFSYLGTRGRLKRFTMMRTILLTNGSPSILSSLNIDFNDSGSTATISFSPTSYGVWDTSVWDTGLWGGGLDVQKPWQSVTGIGYCAAPRLQAASNGIEVSWVSTDIVFEVGAML